jgi:hypothetical protein
MRIFKRLGYAKVLMQVALGIAAPVIEVTGDDQWLIGWYMGIYPFT